MKNREEYVASIYAKRDARLARRKKAVAAVMSALCLIFCFCAAATVMPEMIKKSSPKEVTDTSTVAANTENPENDEGIAYITYIDGYLVSDVSVENVEERAESELEATEHSFADKPVVTDGEYTTYGQKQFANHIIHSENETEIALETEMVEDAVSTPSVTRNPSSLGKYTDDEILDAAFSCLTDMEKNAVGSVEPFVTVTRTKGGDEYYDISYKTDRGRIKITLNAENLELVRRSGSLDSTSATTSAPPMVVTTPAYNPNS